MKFSRIITAAVIGALLLVGQNADAATTTSATASAQATKLATSGVETLVAERSKATIVDSSLTAKVQASLRKLPFRFTSTCIRCNTGPALAAVVSYLSTGKASERKLAVTIFDQLLASQRQSNGSLHPLPTGGDINTMFFADNLGIATVLLGSKLDAAHRTSWTSAVTGGADFLINNKNLSWYTNGNIVIGNALTMALAYRLTGDTKYRTAYQQAWTFAIAPNQERWAGYGFVTTQAAHNANGNDGAGYFAEAGNWIGYDPDYTMLQSEQLGRLYLITKDPSVLRTLNMVTNQLLRRVDRTAWTLDASGGSRHSPPTAEPFDSSALAVLAFVGGRTDLAKYVVSEGAATNAHFFNDLKNAPMGDRGYYALGMITATVVMASKGYGVAASSSAFLNHK
jgi:hypothetical protein